VRFTLIVAATLLAGCGPGGVPSDSSDPTRESWYGQAVDQLRDINRQAESDFQSGKSDKASALIEKGLPLETRVVSVTHPTLAAIEAASDLDDLYGRMLLSNHHYGWARLLFQKNLNRWKHWSPQSPDTARRFQQAATEIAECDRRMEQ
jgi:hypothetical protein